MVQASVAPYPGAPAGYPPTAAQVQATTDGLPLSVSSIKTEPLAQMKNEGTTSLAGVAAAAANNTGANNTNSAATTAAAAQMYLQQKKVSATIYGLYYPPKSLFKNIYRKSYSKTI